MARVEPPKKTDTCPGCRGTRKNIDGPTEAARRSSCQYCNGVGKVTNHRYKTLLAFFKTYPNARRREPDGTLLH